MRLFALALVGLVAVALWSCSDDSTSNVPNLTGSYRGVAVFTFAPADTDTLDVFATLLQSGNTLTGTWLLRSSQADSVTGTIQGGSVVRVSGTGLTGLQISASLASSVTACPATARGISSP